MAICRKSPPALYKIAEISLMIQYMSVEHLAYTLITVALVMGIIINSVAVLTLGERKISAFMQDRLGPNRVGPFGMLQPMADGIKMFLKEVVIPKNVDKLFFILAPIIAASVGFLAFAVVPFGPTHSVPLPVPVTTSVEQSLPDFMEKAQKYDDTWSFVVAPGMDIGILFVFAIGSLAVYGIILGGWAGNNKYSLLGALRSSAQIISYEIPLGMAILGVILYSGSLNLEKIIDWQANHGWFILYQPLAFLLFITSVYAECNRLPFDLPEAEQELIGGYHTEYNSLGFALFAMGEYTHMITTSFLMATVFFGGWHFPGLSGIDGTIGILVKFAIIGAKAGFFLLLFQLVRWTIPRFRFDQLMGLAWQVLIPLSILNLLAVLFVREYGLAEWVMTIVSAILFLGAAVIATRDNNLPKRRVTAHPIAGKRELVKA